MRAFIALFILVMFAAVAAEAGPGKKKRRTKPRRDPIPSILRPSEEALAFENKAADDAGLPRFKDRSELEKAIADGELVPIEDTVAYYIHEELGEEDPDNAELYAYARPWTKKFLDDVLGRASKQFKKKFPLTSLVRTDEYQETLLEHNRAAATGDTPETRSTHLTGATVDIGFKYARWKTRQWLRKRLIALEKEGKILAIEERSQNCFHVLVLPAYDPPALWSDPTATDPGKIAP